MNLLLEVLLIVGSLFLDDDCHHHHCGSSWGHGCSMGLMILIPLVLVGVFLLYGYHSAYLDSPPKRVFISDVDGSKDSRTVAKGTPVAHKAVAKAHLTAHKTAAKHQSTTHQVAHHAN